MGHNKHLAQRQRKKPELMSFLNTPQLALSSRRWLLLMFMLPGLMPLPLLAVEVEGLYDAEVPVIDQGKDTRTEAIRKTFTEILVQVTGNSQVMQDERMSAVIEQATNYVQQYRYRPLGQGTDTVSPSARLLWVRFDASAVNKLLGEMNIPVWGRARPAILVWLAIEDKEKRQLVDATQKEVLQTLKYQARRRGVPLVFPLMDLEDQSNLTFTDVWGNFQASIMQASSRYRTKAVLVGRVFRKTFIWEGRWTLYEGDQTASWDLTGSLDEVLNAGINQTVNVLASRYAKVVDSSRNTLTIEVRGIDSLDDYARTERYLRSLGPVTDVQVAGVYSSRAIFRLLVHGNLNDIVRVLSLSNTNPLVPINTPRQFSGPTNSLPGNTRMLPELTYRLLH